MKNIILLLLIVVCIQGAIIRLIEEKNFYASDATQIAYKDYVEGDSSNYQQWTPIDPTTNTYSTSSNVCTVTSKCNKNAAFANHFYALQFTANKDFKRYSVHEKISITQPHYQVDVQIGILVYGYDQFSATDYFQTWFDDTDSVSIMQTKYVKADYTTRGQYCYDWWDTKLDTSQIEGRYLANLSFTHTKDILWVINKWVSLSNYDQNNLQLRWGVYQFILDYYECHATCKTCTGAANTDCLTCPTNPTLYYKYGASSPYQCLTTCPAGYFQDTSEPEALCSQCNSRCSACYGSSYNKCTACNAGYNLSGNTCQLTCTSNCLTCKENPDSASTCTSCASPRYLYNYACILTCPAGFYPYVDGTTNPYRWCKPCNSKCSSCTDYSTCTACNTGFYLQGSTCYSDCPNGYYENGSVCSACNAACETCTGGSSFNCNECADNYYFHSVDGGCYATCPNYYYKDDLKYPPQCTLCTTLTGLHISGTGVCTPCQNNCKTCNPDIFTCTACYADRFIQTDNTCWKCEDDLGYQTNPSNIHECQEICGDGIRVDSQTECDDGNSINGDGCSNLCKIESGYKCLGGSTSSPDVCVDTNQIAWVIYESDEDKEFINKKENEPFTFKIRFSKKFTFSTSTNLEEQLVLYISEKYDPNKFKVIIQQLSDLEYFIKVYFNMTIQYETLQITFKNPDQFQDIAGFTLEDKTEELNINIYYFSTKAQRKSVAIFTVFQDFYIPNIFYSKPIYDQFNPAPDIKYNGLDIILLNNIGSLFSIFLFALFINMIASFICKITWNKALKNKKFQKIQKICYIIAYQFLEWGFWNNFWQISILIFGNFSFLQLKAFEFGFNGILSIIIVISIIATPILFLIWIYQRKQDLYQEPFIDIGEQYPTIYEKIKNQNYKFRNFWSYISKEKYNISQYYLAFFFLRKTIYGISLINLYESPKASFIFMFIVNLIYLTAIVICKPFKLKRDFIQVILSEILLLVGLVIGFYLAVYNLDITENQRFGVGWALTIILFIILLVHFAFLKINAFIEIRQYIRRKKLEKQYKIHKQILKQMNTEKENEIQDFQEYFTQQNRNQIDEIFEAEENQDIQSRMDRVYGRERGRGKKKTLAQKFSNIIQKHSENISRNQTIINNLNVEKTNINSVDPRKLMNKTKNSRIIKQKEGTYFIPQNIQNLVIHNSEYPSQQTSKNPTIYKGVALQDYDSQRNSNQKLVSEKNSDPDSEIYSQNMIMDSHVDNLTNTNYSQFSTQQKQYQNPNYQRTILESERKLQQNNQMSKIDQQIGNLYKSKSNIRQPIFRQTQNGGMIINPGSDAEGVEQLDDDQQQMQKIKDKLKDQNVSNNNKNYKQNRAQQRKLRNQLAQIDKKKNDPITDFLYGQQNQKDTQEPVISKQLKDEVVKYESEIRRTNQRDNTVYRTLRLTRDKFKLSQIQNQEQK